MPQGNRLGLFTVVTGVFVLSLDVTMLDIVLPDIAAEIGADQAQVSWIADCYNVALAGLILLGAGLGGRFGQRRVYLTGLFIFALGSIVAGITSTPAALIAARTVMGIGAAGMAAPAVALTGIMFAGDRRTRALATWAAASGIALALGPMVGGVIISIATWRWIFFILVPLAAVIFVIGRASLPVGDADDGRELDIPGAALSALALVPLVAALLQIPDVGWSSPWVLAGLAMGLVLLIAFVVREMRANVPMIDLRVLRIPSVTAAASSLAASYAGFLGLLFLASLQLRTDFTLDPVQAGLALAPWALMFWIGARLGALMSKHTGPGRIVVSGMVVLCASFALLTAVSTLGPVWIAIGLSGAGLGCGLITPVSVNLMLSSSPEELLPTSSGLSMVMRYGGGSVALALCATAAALGGGYPAGYAVGALLVALLALVTAATARRDAAAWRGA